MSLSLAVPTSACVCVCSFTLQLSEAIYKPLNTPSLCLSLSLSVSLVLPDDFSDILIPCFLIVLLFPFFHTLTSPPPLINTSFPKASPLVLLHLSLSPSSLLSSLPIISSLFPTDSHITLSVRRPRLFTLPPFASLPCHPLPSPFISPSSSSNSHQFKSPPCPPVSYIWQIHAGWEELRLEQAQPAQCCPEERT